MQLSHNATLLALGPAAAPAVTSQLGAWPAMRPGGSEAAGFSASRLAAPPEFNNAKQAFTDVSFLTCLLKRFIAANLKTS